MGVLEHRIQLTGIIEKVHRIGFVGPTATLDAEVLITSKLEFRILKELLEEDSWDAWLVGEYDGTHAPTVRVKATVDAISLLSHILLTVHVEDFCIDKVVVSQMPGKNES